MRGLHNKLCLDIHICRRCNKKCQCQTYTWACPWRGGDEDDMCDTCLETIATEMEDFEDGNSEV